MVQPDEWRAEGQREGALERHERGRKIIQMERAITQDCVNSNILSRRQVRT